MPELVRPAARRRTERLRAVLRLIPAVLAICAVHVAHAAPKADVVTFANGDRLTGEVKGLEYGRLKFKTDATGTIEIEWNKVAGLQSQQYLQIELSSGARYFGQSPDLLDGGRIRLATGADDPGRELEMAHIVRIAAIDQGDLIDRLDGYVTGGYDYTKTNRQQDFNATAGLKSRTRQRQWSVDGATTLTSQEGLDDTQRFDVTGNYRRFLPGRDFYQGFAALEGNDELGLDLRATVGGAFGRYLMQTGSREWAAYAGLAYTNERFQSGDARDSIEGVLGTSYTFFRYDPPEASVDGSLVLLPSLTQSGRVRAEARLRSRYEIVADLFFELSLYGSFDNEPDEEARSQSDYGLTTSLGYSF